jgi:1-acyl-sn-glycerol-3-phosphate acyltransferase
VSVAVSRPTAARGPDPTVVRWGIYEAVALGLATYARTAFRVRALGRPYPLEPGTLIVSSHRSDADVPLFVAGFYRHAHGRLRRNGRVHFAVRDDLFIPGFFAGYPPRLPLAARRLLFPIGIGGVFGRAVPCLPIRSAKRMRLVELLEDHREEPLDELLPPALREPFVLRAAELGQPEPQRASDVLQGSYADLLWHVVDDVDVTGASAEESWRRRGAAAAGDFRRLVDVVRGGGYLLLFPEGRPSPDGTLGPLMRGVAALVRRAAPRAVLPLAPAYDPLGPGRPRAFLGLGIPTPPPTTDVDDQVLALLRRTTPLTVGQVVASYAGEPGSLDARLAAEVRTARAEGRPFEPELEGEAYRRQRLGEAVSAAAAADEAVLERLAREYASAREG